MIPGARYDGHADWYDDWNKPQAERNGPQISELLGPGAGLCLDLGCGSGHYFDVIAATGRTVVGLDYSADQLRVARGRSRRIVRGDAAALPFADSTFPTVATINDQRPGQGTTIRRADPAGQRPDQELARSGNRTAAEHSSAH